MAATTNTDKINTLTVQMAESLMIQEQVQKDVAKITRILEGNGHPGLIKRMDCIENDWNHHKEEYENEKRDLKDKKKDRKDISWKIILLIIGMIISNVGVIIFNSIK